MKVYNQEKTQILENYDLEKGHLEQDFIIIPEVEAVEEQFHYEIIKVYPNGGKDVKKVIDVEGVEYQPSYQEEIQVYIPYTKKELEEIEKEKKRIAQEKQEEERIFNIQRELDNLLNCLASTDYITNKIVEAETEQEREQIRQEYAETLAQRRVWRNRASELKDLLK